MAHHRHGGSRLDVREQRSRRRRARQPLVGRRHAGDGDEAGIGSRERRQRRAHRGRRGAPSMVRTAPRRSSRWSRPQSWAPWCQTERSQYETPRGSAASLQVRSNVMAGSESAGTAFGANSWLVEEMYEQYRADPESVGESWREFFEDYRSMTAAAHPELGAARGAAGRTRAAPAAHACAPRPPPRRPRRRPARRRPPALPRRGDPGEPIKGVGAVIAANMERSLDGADGDQLPQRPGQAARGQPQGDQRLPRAQRPRQGQLHPPHRLRHRAGDRRRRAER